MAGGAGNDEMKGAQVSKWGQRLDRGMDPSPKDGDFSSWIPSSQAGGWTAFEDKDFLGIGQVTIIDDTKLLYSYYRTTTGEMHDNFTLIRDHSSYIKQYSRA